MGKEQNICSVSTEGSENGGRPFKFVKVSQVTLGQARTPEVMEFFKEHGLQPFVQLDWGGKLDVEDAIEFVQNFSCVDEKTTVRGRVIPLSKICISEVFRLPTGVYIMPRHLTSRTYRSSHFDDKKTQPSEVSLTFRTPTHYDFLQYLFLLRTGERMVPLHFVQWVGSHAANHDWLEAFQRIFHAELLRLQELLCIHKQTENGPSSSSIAGQHIALILAYYQSRGLPTAPCLNQDTITNQVLVTDPKQPPAGKESQSKKQRQAPHADDQGQMCLERAEKRQAQKETTKLQSDLAILSKKCYQQSETLKTVQSKLDTTNQDLTTSRNEVNQLKISLKEAREELTLQDAQLVKALDEKLLAEGTLENEKDRLQCQICMEKPRDTLCLPCSHFLYCSKCLSQHQKRARNKTCPACRGPISGLLKCVLSL